MIVVSLCLSLFGSQLLLVTPFVIEKEHVENTDEPPSLEANKTISESLDPKTTEAPWTNVKFPLEEAEHDGDTCRKVAMYVNFTELALSDEIIAPRGFNVFQCKGKCSSTQRKKFPHRSEIMALLEKKKGVEIDDEACCVPTKLAQLSVIVLKKDGYIVLKTFNDIVVQECGCE